MVYCTRRPLLGSDQKLADLAVSGLSHVSLLPASYCSPAPRELALVKRSHFVCSGAQRSSNGESTRFDGRRNEMAKLYYFEGRGKGEIVRLALAAAEVTFVDEFLSEREPFKQLISDGKLLYGQVPVLEIDGKIIAQANSIVRYLGKKSGLLGKNPDEEVLVDQYYEGGRDFFAPTLPLCFIPEQEVLDGPVKRVMAKYLPVFEKVAAQNDTGFLVGNSLTMADVSVLEGILVCVEYLGIDVLKDYPALQKFYKVVTSDARIAAFLNGPQRQRKNDARYVRDVCTCLGMDLPVTIATCFGVVKK